MVTGLQRQGDDAILLAYRLGAAVDHHRLKLRARRKRYWMLHPLAASNLQGKIGVRHPPTGFERETGQVYRERSSFHPFGSRHLEEHLLAGPRSPLRKPAPLLLLVYDGYS